MSLTDPAAGQKKPRRQIRLRGFFVLLSGEQPDLRPAAVSFPLPGSLSAKQDHRTSGKHEHHTCRRDRCRVSGLRSFLCRCAFAAVRAVLGVCGMILICAAVSSLSGVTRILRFSLAVRVLRVIRIVTIRIFCIRVLRIRVFRIRILRVRIFCVRILRLSLYLGFT